MLLTSLSPPARGCTTWFSRLTRISSTRPQEALAAAVTKSRATGGHCLVLDPGTGEILAMAVVPVFNPNLFYKCHPDQWRNRVVTDCFEPGSTLKAFLVAAALEESVVTPLSEFYCEQGKYKIGGRVVHDTHKYGNLTVSDIVIHSSNIGAIKIGQRLGYAKFCDYLKRFGFSQKTGIDIFGEREGIYPIAEECKSNRPGNGLFWAGDHRHVFTTGDGYGGHCKWRKPNASLRLLKRSLMNQGKQ